MTAILDFAGSIDQLWLLISLLAVLNLWAIGEVWLSRAATRDRWLWTGIVIVCPIIGSCFWFALGPKAPRERTSRTRQTSGDADA
jgi:hypothetical protein